MFFKPAVKIKYLRQSCLQFNKFHISCSFQKHIVANKGKSSSSNEWLTRQMNDIYVKKSRYDHYRCRSAYKLLEIDERYKILKPHFAVVDCGAAPGSWTQVVTKKLKLDTESNNEGDKPKGLVIAVDLQHIDPIKGAILLKESNFTDPVIQEKIFSLLPNGRADVILSDMAPNASGNSCLDSAAIVNLVYCALKFAMRTLKNDGTFLCKVWDSNDVGKMVNGLSNLFSSVKRVKPKACRLDSSELYILARGFKREKDV